MHKYKDLLCLLEKVFNMYCVHFYKYVKTACKGLYDIISGVHNKPSKTFALNASYLCGNCSGAVTRKALPDEEEGASATSFAKMASVLTTHSSLCTGQLKTSFP